MRIEEMISGFLLHNRAEGYDKDIDIFISSIESNGFRDGTLITYLQGIRTDDILIYLERYIAHNNITSIDTALRYCSCVKEFFSYQFHKENLVNESLSKEFALRTYSERSFWYKVNKYISSDDRLMERREFNSLNKDEVRILVKDCDETIFSEEIQSLALKKIKFFNKVRSALILKLIVFTGLRYEHVHVLKKTDIDYKFNTIMINGFTIHLPHNLRIQFEIYENIIEEIDKSLSNREYLFINNSGSKISYTTAIVSGYLKTLTGRGDLNGIIKSAIINMILSGINESFIKKLTGVNDEIFMPCQLKVNEDLDIKADRYLDSKLRNSYLFDIL